MSTPPPDPFALPDWAPSTKDVAALLRARTKDATGLEAGDFTADTRPTADDLTILIGFGCASITASIGTDVADSLKPEAQALAALKTACYIEQSFWPEQVGSDRSAWNEMWQMYTEQEARLRQSAAAGGGGSTIGAGSVCLGVSWTPCDDDPAAWPVDWWQRDLDVQHTGQHP